MAIQTGFPPSSTISPSVRIAEQDLSFIAPEASFHRAGVVGFASKGPINIPTVIRTRRQLETTFGFPHPESSDPYMIYAAQQYLLVANELYIIRVADEENVSHEQATVASVDTPAAGGQIIVISDTAGPYSFTKDSFFRWRLNGVSSVKTLVVLADDNREVPLTGTPYTAAQLAADLNAQLDAELDGIQFFDSSGYIGIRTTFAFGPDAELEFVSVQDSILGGDVVGTSFTPGMDPEPTNVTGLGSGMTHGSVTGLNFMYPNDGYQTAGMYDFRGLTGLNILVVVDGTDNVLIDQVVQEIDLEDLEGAEWGVSTIVSFINSQRIEDGGILPGGWEAFEEATGAVGFRTLHTGRDARLVIKDDSTADGIFGFINFTVFGDSPIGTAGDADDFTLGRINGAANSTGDISVTFTGDSAGIDGNLTQVEVANDIRQGTFSISVVNNGVQVEAWGGLSKNESSRFYVETFLSLVSDWVRAIDNSDNPAPPADGLYDLAGGSDGIPADPDDQDALLIGNLAGFTGMFALSEPEQIDIDLLAIPGHSSTAVILAMIDLCQNFRQDCMAIIDPPFGLTVNEIIAWQNGNHPLNTVRFDTDFAALYWPWVKITDNFNRVDVWAPPSGSVLATIARSDQIAAPWFAPAGLTRGIVSNITDVFNRPTLAERDLMYGNRNAVNPIIQFPDINGFVIWGQKTLQRTPSALDRINVRRMLFVAEKRVRRDARVLLFEPHDEEFRQAFTRLSEEILREIQVGRGLTDFVIQADDELNPPDVIDRNEFRARIGVQPTRAVEFIFVEFAIFRTGADFGDITGNL